MKCNIILSLNVCLVLYFVFVTRGSDACEIKQTNETLAPCEWTSWFAWNCTCTASPLGQQPSAVRMRGLCCRKAFQHDLPRCLDDCGYSPSAGRQERSCYAACGLDGTGERLSSEMLITVLRETDPDSVCSFGEWFAITSLPITNGEWV